MKKNYSTGQNNYFTGNLICCLFKLKTRRLKWVYSYSSVPVAKKCG